MASIRDHGEIQNSGNTRLSYSRRTWSRFPKAQIFIGAFFSYSLKARTERARTQSPLVRKSRAQANAFFIPPASAGKFEIF